jgi:hypothetical protein
MTKIGFFVPLAFPFGLVPQEFFLSFFRANEYLMQRTGELPYKDVSFQLFSPSTFPIDANRNECVALAKENKIDISIWLDADQELAEDTLFRMLKHGKDFPIYAGIYYLKAKPYHPIVFKANKNFKLFYPIWRYPKDELFYADMIGMGCVKIDTKVFDSLEAPYFKYSPIPRELVKIDEKMAFKHKNKVHDVSEDVAFWRQLFKKTDYRIVVDPRMQVGHIRKDVVEPGFVMQQAYQNKLITQKQMGEKFDAYWDKEVTKAELVKPNGKPDYII